MNMKLLPTLNCMIVLMRWNFLEGSRKDSEQTTTLAETTGAELGSVTVTKKLFPPAVLADLRSIKNEARRIIQAATLPWDDIGGRILPTASFASFQKKMMKLEERLELAIREMVDNYDAIKDEARIRLNGLFNESEFPTREDIKDAYKMVLKYTPVPRGEHITLDALSDADQKMLKDELDSTTEAQFNEAHKENYRRLLDTVMKLFGRLGTDKDGKPEVFQSSTVNNLLEVLENGKALNILNDPKLDEMIDTLKGDLEDMDIDALRHDPRHRFGVRASLKDTVDRISEMGVF